MTRKKRFQIGLEEYEFARFAAAQGAAPSANAYLEALLAEAFRDLGNTGPAVPPAAAAPSQARCPHRGAVLTSGYVHVFLAVPEDIWTRAVREHAEWGYFNPMEMMHGHLNAALASAMTACDDRARKSGAGDWRPAWLEHWLGRRAQ